MHAPDGFLDAGTALATAGLSAGAVAVALRSSRTHLDDRQVPLAGMAAAFVFAAQMVNFPVAAGTTGHLLGGALAAILLGPAVGTLVVTVVVVIQALVFADGGLTALGYNVLNMAVITSLGGYAVFRGLRRILPTSTSGLVTASGVAAGLSVVMAAMAFSIEWLFGATAPVPFDTVFGSMVGVHLLIGVGEGLITAMVMGAVLAARPDLVFGASGIDRARLRGRARADRRGLAVAGALIALTLAMAVSQFSGSGPDGLERVAHDTGIAASAGEHALASSPFAEYATRGLENRSASLAVAGASGVLVVSAVGLGMFAAVRKPRRVEGSTA